MDNKVLKEIEKTLTKNSTSDRPDTQFIYLDNGFSYFTEASGRIAVKVNGELPFEQGDISNEIGTRLLKVFSTNDINSWQAYDLPDKKSLMGMISDKKANDVDYDSKHNYATIEFGEAMFRVDTLKDAFKYAPTCNKILVKPDGKLSAMVSTDITVFVFGTLPRGYKHGVDAWREKQQAKRDKASGKLVTGAEETVPEDDDGNVDLDQTLNEFWNNF